MITLKNINKRYKTAAEGEYALRDINLHIDEGDLVAIVGTSGSGKTTLLNLIGGLDRDYTGQVLIDGQDLGKLSDRALSDLRNRKIGFVFQQFSLLDHCSALDNVALPANFARGPVNFANPKQRAIETLKAVGLEHKLNAFPGSLSGGQKQRVAIARALLFKPKLLLCDEPTGSLDTQTGQQIINIFQELNREGYTIVIITHEARVSAAAHRVIRIEDGHLVDEKGAEA